MGPRGLPIPNWAPDIQTAQWANIHDLIGTPRRLTGVDSFCGDPSAHTLILGKDFAPARVIRERLRQGDADPWRHDPKLPTNRMIADVLGRVGIVAPVDGANSASCKVYYANAYYLLRDDDKFAGALPNARAAWAASQRMLTHIIISLSQLERIIAMGEDAYGALAKLYGLDTPWRRAVNDGIQAPISLGDRSVRICASVHLGARGVRNRIPGAPRADCVAAIHRDWENFFDGRNR